jgi:hypothetical protein
MHFSGATVDTGENFGSKFGHYTNGSGLGTLDKPAPGGLAEASVRAGRLYNSEASVRAGSMNKNTTVAEDPSVRLRGSNLEGSVHLKTSKLMSDESLQGLAPVRVVKRTGSNNVGAAATPAITVPVTQIGFSSKMGGGDSLTDSVKEHMLRLAPEELATIGE